MEKQEQTDQRRFGWIAIVAGCSLLFWYLGYTAAKFANGMAIDFNVMDVMQLGSAAFLIGFGLRQKR